MDVFSETSILFGYLIVRKPPTNTTVRLLIVQREMKMHLKLQRKFYVKAKFSN
jgi:hypothetical protein